MRMRTWPFLLIGFGALLLLIALSAVALHSRMGQVYREVSIIQQGERDNRRLLNQLRSELYQTAILVRDYLLEPSPEAAANERQSLEELRTAIQKDVASLETAVQTENLETSAGLHEAILKYWRSMEPIFQWTPSEKGLQGRAFLRRSVVPYRDAVLAAAEKVGEVSARQTLTRQEQILQTQEDLKSALRQIAGFALVLGAVVAFFSIVRTRSLEAAAATHLAEIERNAGELRNLSHKLGKAQEDERRSLSRELHDQVGQMLTALSMELGNIEELLPSRDEQIITHVEEAKKLNQETLRAVRNISSGLRPSVLDELGLVPALRWQAREFSRRSGVPVDLQLDGEIVDLPEEYRTCIYRVVQESLTNSARHAQARLIRVTLHGGMDMLCLTVEDDGKGFDVQQARGRGLGLLNIEERVRELGGRVQFDSRPSRGTQLRCEIPIPKEVAV
ncbi:MAG: ATP-binding protein [Bryobacteraceae bacterium]